ncbi:hypothetical protein [Actinokineospora sp. NPDC004072]
MRTLLAWLLGLAGTAAVAYGTFSPWHNSRPATELPLADLFTGIHPDQSTPITSLALLTLLGAAITTLGLLLSTMALRAAAALLLLTVLVWTVQYGGLANLQIGYWNTTFGTLLILVAATLKH